MLEIHGKSEISGFNARVTKMKRKHQKLWGILVLGPLNAYQYFHESRSIPNFKPSKTAAIIDEVYNIVAGKGGNHPSQNGSTRVKDVSYMAPRDGDFGYLIDIFGVNIP